MPRGRSATYDDQRELILAQAAQLFALGAAVLTLLSAGLSLLWFNRIL